MKNSFLKDIENGMFESEEVYSKSKRVGNSLCLDSEIAYIHKNKPNCKFNIIIDFEEEVGANGETFPGALVSIQPYQLEDIKKDIMRSLEIWHKNIIKKELEKDLSYILKNFGYGDE